MLPTASSRVARQFGEGAVDLDDPADWSVIMIPSCALSKTLAARRWRSGMEALADVLRNADQAGLPSQ